LPSRYRSSVSWQKLHFRWIKARDSRKVVTPFTRQQLIDEVFCYLKTVKVTAAVYLSLYKKLLTFRFRYQAPGRSQTIYFIFYILHCPVFLLNSRHPRFCATLFLPNYNPVCFLIPKVYAKKKHLFSRSYKIILPSSLNLVAPFALLYSSKLHLFVLSTVKTLSFFAINILNWI